MDPNEREHTSRRLTTPPSTSAVDALLEDQPRMLNLAQVGELLSASATTVRRLVESGVLPAMRLSRQWRVARDDLRTYMLTPAELDDSDEVQDSTPLS